MLRKWQSDGSGGRSAGMKNEMQHQCLELEVEKMKKTGIKKLSSIVLMSGIIASQVSQVSLAAGSGLILAGFDASKPSVLIRQDEASDDGSDADQIDSTAGVEIVDANDAAEYEKVEYTDSDLQEADYDEAFYEEPGGEEEIYEEDVYEDDSPENTVSSTARIYADAVNVRADRSLDSEIIDVVENTLSVEVLEDHGDWLLVMTPDGTYGYVASEYISTAAGELSDEEWEEERSRLEAEWALYLEDEEAERQAAGYYEEEGSGEENRINSVSYEDDGEDIYEEEYYDDSSYDDGYYEESYQDGYYDESYDYGYDGGDYDGSYGYDEIYDDSYNYVEYYDDAAYGYDGSGYDIYSYDDGYDYANAAGYGYDDSYDYGCDYVYEDTGYGYDDSYGYGYGYDDSVYGYDYGYDDTAYGYDYGYDAAGYGYDYSYGSYGTSWQDSVFDTRSYYNDAAAYSQSSQLNASAQYQAYLDAMAAADAATQGMDEALVYETAAEAQRQYQLYVEAEEAAYQASLLQEQAAYLMQEEYGYDYTQDYQNYYNNYTQDNTGGNDYTGYTNQSYDYSDPSAYGYVQDASQTYTEPAPAYEEPAVSTIGQEIASYATQFVGNPYVWGGTSLTNGADCSGFVMSIYDNYGVSLPHNAAEQSGYGTSVSMDSLQPGDLLFYSDGSEIGHVSMYIGNDQVVHASSSTTGIIISDIDYRTPVSAKRLIDE